MDGLDKIIWKNQFIYAGEYMPLDNTRVRVMSPIHRVMCRASQ